jgi:hypothetical protein
MIYENVRITRDDLTPFLYGNPLVGWWARITMSLQ